MEQQPEEETLSLTPEQIMGQAWDELMEQVEAGWWSMEEAVALFHRTFPDKKE